MEDQTEMENTKPNQTKTLMNRKKNNKRKLKELEDYFIKDTKNWKKLKANNQLTDRPQSLVCKWNGFPSDCFSLFCSFLELPSLLFVKRVSQSFRHLLNAASAAAWYSSHFNLKCDLKPHSISTLKQNMHVSFKHLHRLTLSNATIACYTLLAMLDQLKNLYGLSLIDCSLSIRSAYSSSNSNVTSIQQFHYSLNKWDKSSSEGLSRLVSSVPSLHSLTIVASRDHKNMKSIFPATLTMSIDQLKQLQRLKLQNFHMTDDLEFFTAVSHLEQLEVLSLPGTTFPSSPACFSLISSLPLLREMHLLSSHVIYSVGVLAPFVDILSATKLQFLSAPIECHPQMIETLLQLIDSVPSLQHLKLFVHNKYLPTAPFHFLVSTHYSRFKQKMTEIQTQRPNCRTELIYQ